MARCYGLIGAVGVGLLLVAGCTMDSFSLTALGVVKSEGPVIAGSLDATTVAAQQTLRGDMGLFVTTHRDSDTVKLTSTTAGGKRFTLVLKAHKTDHGEETQASIQWEKDADDAFWIQLAAKLAKPQPTSPNLWDGDKPLFPNAGPTGR
jgi:hypothetical protein